MKIIYLASFTAYHQNYNIVYQDINGKRDISGDMLDTDLSTYDVIIATPPCNYYSRGNYRRKTSEYSQKTKHLLPDIIDKLNKIGKPFIVENVRNETLLKPFYRLSPYVYTIGRHTYWTNIKFEINTFIQIKEDIQNKSKKLRQGDQNVHMIFEYWLNLVKNKYFRNGVKT